MRPSKTKSPQHEPQKAHKPINPEVTLKSHPNVPKSLLQEVNAQTEPEAKDKEGDRNTESNNNYGGGRANNSLRVTIKNSEGEWRVESKHRLDSPSTLRLPASLRGPIVGVWCEVYVGGIVGEAVDKLHLVLRFGVVLSSTVGERFRHQLDSNLVCHFTQLLYWWISTAYCQVLLRHHIRHRLERNKLYLIRSPKQPCDTTTCQHTLAAARKRS